MPTIAGCSSRTGRTSNSVMLLRPRRFSTPVSVEVPTLARTSRNSLESSVMRFPLFLHPSLMAPGTAAQIAVSHHRCLFPRPARLYHRGHEDHRPTVADPAVGAVHDRPVR